MWYKIIQHFNSLRCLLLEISAFQYEACHGFRAGASDHNLFVGGVLYVKYFCGRGRLLAEEQRGICDYLSVVNVILPLSGLGIASVNLNAELCIFGLNQKILPYHHKKAQNISKNTLSHTTQKYPLYALKHNIPHPWPAVYN